LTSFEVLEAFQRRQMTDKVSQYGLAPL